MATIINNPDAGTAESNASLIVVVLVLLVAGLLFFTYGLPDRALETGSTPQTIDVNVTTPNPTPEATPGAQ